MFSRHSIFPLLWSLTVGVLCGLPGNSFPDLGFWKLLEFDSVAHACVFAVYAFLWAVAFSKQRQSVFLRRYAQPVAAFSGMLYGALLEILQFLIFYRRSAEWSDMLADSIGCLMGWLVFRLVYQPVLRRQGLQTS